VGVSITSRSARTPNIIPAPSRQRSQTPKYTAKKHKALSRSFSIRVSEHKNCIFFSCLCLWALSLLIWMAVAFGSSSSSSLPVVSLNALHRRNDEHKMEGDPPWMHPIEPWEILPRPPKGPPPPMKCSWTGPLPGFLAGCANDGCKNVNDAEEAKEKCSSDELCTGIIKVAKDREIYQLRSGGKISESPSGELSWRKSCVVDEEKLKRQQMEQQQHKEGEAGHEGAASKSVDRLNPQRDRSEREEQNAEEQEVADDARDADKNQIGNGQ